MGFAVVKNDYDTGTYDTDKCDNVIYVNFHRKKNGEIDHRFGKKPERKRPNDLVLNQTMECLYNREEILSVYNVFKSKVDNAASLAKEMIARRNLCMFVAAINLGLRAGDLCRLKWLNIFDSQWKYMNEPGFIPEKTRRKNNDDTVKLSWNTDFEIELSKFLEWKNKYIKNQTLDDYIFTTQKPHYDKDLKRDVDHIEPKEWWRIMEKTRKEAGIKQKIGTHGLRKTMVHSYIMEAEDREDGMCDMQDHLKHESRRTTTKYSCMDKGKIKRGKQRFAYIHG